MPKMNQTTISAPKTERKLQPVASAGTETLIKIFGQSPIYQAKEQFASVEKLVEHFQTTVLDGVIDDKGHLFGEVNLDFAHGQNPLYGEVEVGGTGDPASPWVPNPVSPGEGMNWTDVGAPPDGFGYGEPDQWGSGVGSQLSPRESSEKISGQQIGKLSPDRSSVE